MLKRLRRVLERQIRLVVESHKHHRLTSWPLELHLPIMIPQLSVATRLPMGLNLPVAPYLPMDLNLSPAPFPFRRLMALQPPMTLLLLIALDILIHRLLMTTTKGETPEWIGLQTMNAPRMKALRTLRPKSPTSTALAHLHRIIHVLRAKEAGGDRTRVQDIRKTGERRGKAMQGDMTDH